MSESLSEHDLRRAIAAARTSASADQLAADSDQSAAETDQASADADQTASDADETGAEADQLASDQDQATADRDRADHRDLSTADEQAYEGSRELREAASFGRLGSRFGRHATSRDRDETAVERDRVAEIRDEGGRRRDANAAGLELSSSEREAQLLAQLAAVRAEAAADRLRAAQDRARAAAERAAASRERSRLEAELRAAHLDGLTGAYRREMGRLAIGHEIDRARRAGEPLVVAFVDVDDLKLVNDRGGHAAGDRVLQQVVQAMRNRLRSFDPIIRYGGDEFVCGLGGTDLGEARRRFRVIADAIAAEAGVGISVGLAELAPGDTADALTERADVAMLDVKAAHHTSRSRSRRLH